jgi:hypothetical protein
MEAVVGEPFVLRSAHYGKTHVRACNGDTVGDDTVDLTVGADEGRERGEESASEGGSGGSLHGVGLRGTENG